MAAAATPAPPSAWAPPTVPAPPPPPVTAAVSQPYTSVPLSKKRRGVGVAVGAVAAALVVGIIALAATRKGTSSTSVKPLPTTQVPRSTNAPSTVAPAIDSTPIDTTLDRFDIKQTDAPGAIANGFGGNLIRVCSETPALEGVASASNGASLAFPADTADGTAMRAASLTGRFETEVEATLWFDRAVAITVGCEFPHSNGAVEKVTDVVPTTRPSGMRIVRFSWSWRGGSLNEVGDDVYFLYRQHAGVVNCQIAGETIDATRCDAMIDAYAKRMETA
jgi:hypothetical protein